MEFPLLPIDRELGNLFPNKIFANGGRLRDYFSAKIHNTEVAQTKDFDYVLIGCTPEEAEEKLRKLGHVTIAGHFPVFKVRTAEGLDLDVALARRELSTGIRHRDFSMTFGPEVTLEQDAQRRDFTCNMISVSCTDGKVHAPQGAMNDITKRLIRVINDTTFSDDPLRMLRAAQFAARLGFDVERGTMQQMQRDSPLSATVEGERISEEMRKLLTKSARPSDGYRILAKSGVLQHILPEIAEGVGCEQNKHHKHDVFNHVLAALDYSKEQGGDIVDQWAAVLHDVGKPRTQAQRPDGDGYSFHGHEHVGSDMVRDIFNRLRESHEMTTNVASLVNEHMFAIETSRGNSLSDSSIRRFLRKVTRGTEDLEVAKERLDRQFHLRLCDRAGSGRPLTDRADQNNEFERRAKAILNERPAMNVTSLDIKGTDVIRAAISTGARDKNYKGDKLVKETLTALLEVVTDDPTMNERSRLSIIMHKHLQEHNRDKKTTIQKKMSQER